MRTRLTAGLLALAAGLAGLATAQDKGKDKKEPPKAAPGPAPKHLYGYDLSVRPAGEGDPLKAVKVGVEVFRHDATGAAIGISESGAVAVFPAPPNLGPDKAAKRLAGLDLSVRPAGEVNFTAKTPTFGVELFRDQATGRAVYASQAKAITFGGPAPTAGGKGPRWHHGLEARVREADRKTFEGGKRVGIEASVDENTGGLIYITDTGALATAPAPGPNVKFDPAKLAPPRSLYGLLLRARTADEAEFTAKTRQVRIEAFEDPNAGVMFYVSDAGSIATAPLPGKLPDNPPEPTWKAAMNLKVRPGGEPTFAKANRYGVEVYQDNRTGSLVFVSQTGSIAVMPK